MEKSNKKIHYSEDYTRDSLSVCHKRYGTFTTNQRKTTCIRCIEWINKNTRTFTRAEGKTKYIGIGF